MEHLKLKTMRVWELRDHGERDEIRHGYRSHDYESIEEAYECGYEDGYEEAMEEMEHRTHHRTSYRMGERRGRKSMR